MFDIHNWIATLSVAEDTKILLKELIARKEKERQLKIRLMCLSVINAVILVIVVFWLFKMNRISRSNIFEIIDYFSASRASVFFIILTVTLFIYSGYVSKEHKKKKEKYDHLREEVSRKLSATWKINIDSQMKDEISEVLHSKKDINIRYLK